ncbi:unnamed protein product [Nippostrongylus brasiliensis]|uniref:C2H2-type domain-containing protein n=1 Tax=Nippostrongylus brasiliensis TaxID=27835 RepID=A0A0N4Y9B5_NIPBR|nr:hypothetical protein Q1695_006572 [Nippostrongylus brasiliensis]VDL76475.1 unnamed protein product [Nippostrongylus brasiliensis]
MQLDDMESRETSGATAECSSGVAPLANTTMHEGMIKTDISEEHSAQELENTTPIRIMSTITPSRETSHPHRLPPGVRVVRGSSASGAGPGMRPHSHQIRTALGTGASHPGRMVTSGLTTAGTQGTARTAPIRTVVGGGAGMRVMQQGGRTLIAVPSGSRLAATLTSVAARAAPVELSTSEVSGPSLAVIDVNRPKSNVKLDENMSNETVTATMQDNQMDANHSGNDSSGETGNGRECMASMVCSTSSVSPGAEVPIALSAGSLVEEKRGHSGVNRLATSNMVTRRMSRDAVPAASNAGPHIQQMEFGTRNGPGILPSARRRAMKRPKYTLSSGDLVRAQYILPSDQLPRRSCIPREENPLSITEQARLSRRPIVVHSSGVEFAIPLSLEAHPMKLDDTAPENPNEDILRDDDGLPYCHLCHSVLKTWQGYEYHIMSVHLKYRPYRCMYCMKEFFYTEEEGLSHVRSQHHGKTVTLLREYHDDKDKEMEDAFCALFLAVREGPNFTVDRAAAIEKAAFMHLQKFKRMRMKVPEFATRAKSLRDFASQTFASMNSPLTMVPSMKYMPERHQFEHLQHHLEPLQHPDIVKVMEMEHSDGSQRYVRMSNGELAELNEQYVIADDDEGPVGEYIEVDYVDEIIDDGEEEVRDGNEVVVEHLQHGEIDTMEQF